MADVHVKISNDASNNRVVFDNPGVVPLAPNAGQTISVQKDGSGKTIAVTGQVSGTSVVFNSPA